MFTSSIEPDAAEGVKKQYELILRYFEGESFALMSAIAGITKGMAIYKLINR